MNTNHKRGRTGLKGMALAVLASRVRWTGFVALLAMTNCLFQTSFAQIVEGEDEFPSIAAKKTIVRTVSEDKSLIYSDDGVDGRFILYDHAAAQAYQAKILPNTIIKDFEVYKERAYFCGQMDLGWTMIAVVGQFDIADVFYNSAPIYYCTMTFWPTPWIVLMRDATRMTVYDDGSDVHIFAIGSGLHGYPAPYLYDASTMFAATMDPQGNWDFCINYSKDRKLNYIDIDCTEHYVGFTAVDSVDSLYIGISNHPDRCFFYAGAPDVYCIGTHVEKERALITGMEGDRFTVAYQPKASRWIEFVQVPLPIPPSFKVTETDSSLTAPACTTWALRDLRYSEATDKVLLVGDMHFMPCNRMESWIVDYDWSGVINSRIPNQYEKNLSVDHHLGSSRFISTGNYSGELIFTVDDILVPATEFCFEPWLVAAEWNDRTHIWDYAKTDETKRYNEQSIKDTPEVTPIEVEIICGNRNNE